MKTPQFLKNQHMISELDKRIFLSKEELEAKRKAVQDKDDKAKGSTMYQFADERDEAAQIKEQMLVMAQSMKHMANNFKTKFEQDQKLMNQIESKQETNIVKTEAEHKRITQLQQSSFFGFWQKLILLFLGMFTFVFMLWFIWLFPSKIKYSRKSNSYLGKFIQSIGRGAHHII